MTNTSWWQEFEARVDATGVAAEDPMVTLFKKLEKNELPPFSRETLKDLELAILGDPENTEPIVMAVYTPQGWMNYTFEVADLETISWRDLPTLIATEGPANFREVTTLAKSRYEMRCGYLTPSIRRLPQRMIDDLCGFLGPW